MAKRLQEYVRYSTKELDEYTQTEGSCVRKVNTNLHFTMGPYCLNDFKRAIVAHIVRTKVGFYDVHLGGIVLDVKNIKVLGRTGALRSDDHRIHININANVYVFKPEEGAELKGIVKHIGPQQVGVILYRVFNANLRVSHEVDKTNVQMDQEVKFRIRKYNLQSIFPYLDGELLTPRIKRYLCNVKREDNQEDNGDSGIEEKYCAQDLDGLLSAIKTEAPSEYEEAVEEISKKKIKISKASTSEDLAIDKNLQNAKDRKSSKKRKRSSCISSTNAEEHTEPSSVHTPPIIKSEITFNNDSL